MEENLAYQFEHNPPFLSTSNFDVKKDTRPA
jgi:hypothetical protein